ncbi:uncharacterized protein HKW66_Vig0143490 [Vigna angularis]|uniref:Secreted protein n=1 Tax=Phaseolus angularis TaxID=3914 RepID=A0A8T0KH68_PHAAN|nr:uncharacterized protein HKW66_Vig0143490 [Vigna angularis]
MCIICIVSGSLFLLLLLGRVPVHAGDHQRGNAGRIGFDVRSPSLLQGKTADGKQKVPEIFNRVRQSNRMQFTSVTETSSKDMKK